MCFISSGSFSGQKRCQVLRTDKNITNKNGWGNHSSNLSCPFKGRQMCWRPNTFFSPFYQQLAVVAGRCLDWFSVNPDTLSHYTHADTHTHRVVSRLQAQAALWAETLQNASQNNNLLSDTNTAIICKPPSLKNLHHSSHWSKTWTDWGMILFASKYNFLHLLCSLLILLIWHIHSLFFFSLKGGQQSWSGSEF